MRLCDYVPAFLPARLPAFLLSLFLWTMSLRDCLCLPVCLLFLFAQLLAKYAGEPDPAAAADREAKVRGSLRETAVWAADIKQSGRRVLLRARIRAVL